MAKYTIIHSCGHEITHELFGKHSGFGGRDSKREWLEQQPCLDCRRKDEEILRENQSREAAQANQLLGASPLEGSEKQVQWAETIRHRTLSSFNGAVVRIKSAPEPQLLVEYAVQATIQWLLGIAEAKWWIETVGTLKSKEGLAPLFGLIDGKTPPASESEILRHVMLESPHLNAEVAETLRLGEQFRARLAERTSKAAKVEMEKELAANKPKRPQWFQSMIDAMIAQEPARADSRGWWNGKVYSGGRVFLWGKEVRLSKEQAAELTKHLQEKTAWLAEEKKLQV